MSSKKPLAPTSRPKKKAEPATTEHKPAPAATVSKAALIPVFVYGSLKEGFRLHPYYLADQQKVGEAVIEGFSMVSLGQYPALIRTDNPDHKVMGEYYLVSEEAYNLLKKMEEDAGYSTESVKGVLTSMAGAATTKEVPFTAKAWVYINCHKGTRVWDTFTSKGKDYLYVRTIDDSTQQENKTP